MKTSNGTDSTVLLVTRFSIAFPSSEDFISLCQIQTFPAAQKASQHVPECVFLFTTRAVLTHSQHHINCNHRVLLCTVAIPPLDSQPGFVHGLATLRCRALCISFLNLRSFFWFSCLLLPRPPPPRSFMIEMLLFGCLESQLFSQYHLNIIYKFVGDTSYIFILISDEDTDTMLFPITTSEML